jgi:purine-binding chemotaxis protein CheW
MNTAVRSSPPAMQAECGPPVAGRGAGQFLTFALGHEEYGISISKVREIRRYDNVRSIADAPAFIKGVLDLRGTIVPVIDLRIKFNASEAVYNEFTVIIVLALAQRLVAIVVDSVSDVVTLTGADIKAAPDFRSSFDVRYLQGMGAVGNRMLILVEIEHIVASGELACCNDAGTE